MGTGVWTSYAQALSQPVGRLTGPAARRPTCGTATWRAQSGPASERPGGAGGAGRVGAGGLSTAVSARDAPTRAHRRRVGASRRGHASTPDHHSAYLTRTVAALTPQGHKRVDELLDHTCSPASCERGRRWPRRGRHRHGSRRSRSGATATTAAIARQARHRRARSVPRSGLRAQIDGGGCRYRSSSATPPGSGSPPLWRRDDQRPARVRALDLTRREPARCGLTELHASRRC